jgi:gluconate 2-dehydrogenase alpha chain
MDELDYEIRLRMMQNITDETVTHCHSSRDQAAPIKQYGSFHPGTGVGRWSVAVKTPLKTIDFDLN